jgi:hypothetical protein
VLTSGRPRRRLRRCAASAARNLRPATVAGTRSEDTAMNLIDLVGAGSAAQGGGDAGI